MKGKFELSVNFECEDEATFSTISQNLNSAIGALELVDKLKEFNASAVHRVLDVTDSLGSKLCDAKFNPASEDFVSEIKERCARVIDMIATLENKEGFGIVLKQDAVLAILKGQMEAVRLKFL